MESVQQWSGWYRVPVLLWTNSVKTRTNVLLYLPFYRIKSPVKKKKQVENVKEVRSKTPQWRYSEITHQPDPHLLLVLPSGWVQRLDECGCMADEHGVAGGSNDHTEHGEPDVWHALRRLSSISNAQHVAHGLKEGKGIELAPWVILLGETEGRQRDEKESVRLS